MPPYPPAVRPAEIRLAVLISSLALLDLVLWLAFVPLIPRWESEFGLSHTQSGVVLGAYSGAILVLSIPAGRLADRIGARRVTIAATLFFAATAPLYAFVDSFWQLLALRFLGGAFSAVSWTAALSWLVASVPDQHRTRAMAAVNASASAASLLGPLIGGPLVSGVGLEPAMLGLGLVILAVGVWALLEPSRGRRDAATDRSALAALRIGWSEPLLRYSFAGILFAAWAMGTVQLLAALRLADLGLSSAGIGWIFALGAALSTVVALYVGRRITRLDKRRMARAAIVAVSALLAGLVVSLAATPYAIGVIAISTVGTAIWTTVYPMCSEAADRAGIGQGVALGALNTVWAFAAVIAPVLAGVFAEGGRPGFGYLIAAILGVCVATLMRRGTARLASNTAGT